MRGELGIGRRHRAVGRGPLTFRQQDLVRAIKAAQAAGLDVAKVEVDKDGKIVIIVGDPTGEPAKEIVL